MKKLITVFAFAFIFGVLAGVPVVAHDTGEDHSHEDTQSESESVQLQGGTEPEASEDGAAETESSEGESTESASGSYDYVAQEGDSYHLMARKAIQTHGLETETNLSGAEIIYAETMMTQEAGSPVLSVGQSVSIDKADVMSWVEKAQQLSDADEAAWEVYVQFVEFNTDHVGEAR